MITTSKQTKVLVGSAMLGLWALVALFFYSPAKPLDDAEIDSYMGRVQALLEQSFVMPEGSGLDARGLQGALADLRGFAERDDGKPVYMVNLMKWRRGELSFPAGADLAGEIDSAEQADAVYNQRLFWTLLANYSHTAYLASAEDNALNYGTSADGDADGWGEIGIFRYNSRRDFFEMVTSDAYLNALYLKLVSMGAIAIAPTQPHGLLFNPMPDVPVLLFFVMTIGYLVYLLAAGRPAAGRA